MLLEGMVVSNSAVSSTVLAGTSLYRLIMRHFLQHGVEFILCCHLSSAVDIFFMVFWDNWGLGIWESDSGPSSVTGSHPTLTFVFKLELLKLELLPPSRHTHIHATSHVRW